MWSLERMVSIRENKYFARKKKKNKKEETSPSEITDKMLGPTGRTIDIKL